MPPRKVNRQATASNRQEAGDIAYAQAGYHRWAPVLAKSPLIDGAMEFWQPLSSRTLSREDAREIIENVTGFFAVLLEWESQDRAQATGANPSATVAEPAERPLETGPTE